MSERKESDQLPEQGPEEQVPDDDSDSREDTGRNAGVPGEEATGTGNPDAAGTEDPDSGEE